MAVVATLVSCAKFDYESILEQLRDHEERIERLETECVRLNRNIEAIQIILEALKENDYITDIVKIMEDEVEVGYSITFAKSGTITIYHGADSADGSNGAAPKIGIRKASDGEYYWTAGDEWLTDESGAKIPAAVPNDPDGKYITPSFRIAEGVWYISCDGGSTWKELEAMNGGISIFKNISYDDDYIYITLADGTVLTILRGESPISQEGEDLTHLFDFDGHKAEAYSIDNKKFTSSSVFDSAIADLSAYAGRTIEITIPQYSNMYGKEVGYATIMVDGDKNFLRQLKRWEVYASGTKNGILKKYRITLPEDMKYMYTSTYMADTNSYLGENDGRSAMVGESGLETC